MAGITNRKFIYGLKASILHCNIANCPRIQHDHRYLLHRTRTPGSLRHYLNDVGNAARAFAEALFAAQGRQFVAQEVRTAQAVSDAPRPKAAASCSRWRANTKACRRACRPNCAASQRGIKPWNSSKPSWSRVAVIATVVRVAMIRPRSRIADRQEVSPPAVPRSAARFPRGRNPRPLPGALPVRNALPSIHRSLALRIRSCARMPPCNFWPQAVLFPH